MNDDESLFLLVKCVAYFCIFYLIGTVLAQCAIITGAL